MRNFIIVIVVLMLLIMIMVVLAPHLAIVPIAIFIIPLAPLQPFLPVHYCR